MEEILLANFRIQRSLEILSSKISTFLYGIGVCVTIICFVCIVVVCHGIIPLCVDNLDVCFLNVVSCVE